MSPTRAPSRVGDTGNIAARVSDTGSAILSVPAWKYFLQPCQFHPAFVFNTAGEQFHIVNMPETRDSLIVQVQNPANGEAWEQFTTIYRPVVYRLARTRGLQDADADDLAQQVLLAVARAIPDWQRNNSQM